VKNISHRPDPHNQHTKRTIPRDSRSALREIGVNGQASIFSRIQNQPAIKQPQSTQSAID
jgi:hypothetical protein